MFTHSIRWRLQFWLALLLTWVLSGFAFGVYQRQRIHLLQQTDQELEQRLAALSSLLRGRPGFEFGPGRPPFHHGPGGPDFGGGGRRPGPPPDGDGSRMPDGLEKGGGMQPQPLPFGGPGMPPFDGPRGMGPGPWDFKLTPEVASLFDEGRTNGFYYAIWLGKGASLKSSTNAPASVAIPERVRDSLTHTRTREMFRESFYFTERGDCVLVGHSITGDMEAMRRFKYLLLAAGSAVLALGLGGGWWLASRAIRPIEEISAAASRISAGNLAERISVADPRNELGQLAGVLNSTFSRLEAAFAQQKQFTADASHELRTPLAVIISEAQTTLAHPRDAADYREAVEVCLESAQQIRRLTDSLLELAHLDAGQDQIERGPLDLAEVTRTNIERLRPLVQERGLGLKCTFGPARVQGNADRLGQVITNLINNALHYNKPEGEIRIATGTHEDDAFLTVSDTGIGIAAADLPHIFERFYRADKARSRSQGRCGLGLAICKAIVEAEGGRIEVASEPGTGSTFTVWMSADLTGS